MNLTIPNRFIECQLMGLESYGAGSLLTSKREKLNQAIERDDAPLASALLNQLWTEAERVSGKSQIALLTARGVHPTVLLGLLFHRALAADSLGSAVKETFINRQALSIGEFIRWQRQSDGLYLLSVGYIGGMDRCSPARAEFTLAIILSALSCIAGHHIRPKLTSLNRRSIQEFELFKSVFGPNICAGASTTSILLEPGDVDAPLPTAAPLLRKLLDPVLDAVFRTRTSSGVIASVQAAIHEELPHGNITRAHIAKRMCMSERTLQRRLAGANTSYAEVLDQVRAELAKLLTDHGVHVHSKLAFELGYSDPSCVYRAMRRWGIKATKSLNLLKI
ncbi:AraC family transcriptional regulator [Aquabacterium sp. NJ1]|uniref:AraC family transcriptional regulator n=1 Tax=Aquabacterium sp. NJ1 TaxID=1538295 RepID=UPI001378B6B6|nr:AraC family transcriptional regulator [Aquabacterium sp. NJ1]